MSTYNCDTNVDTQGVLDFTDGWKDCTGITTFPYINTYSGILFNSTWEGCTNMETTADLYMPFWLAENFTEAWYGCSSLESFPLISVDEGQIFNSTWYGCSSLTAFPAINFVSGTSFQETWKNCSSLTTFPAGVFDNCQASNFSGAFVNCALTEESVDNILISLDQSGTLNGIIDFLGGTTSFPGELGYEAKTSLEGKGWVVNFPEYNFDSTWLDNYQLQSIFITGNPA